MCSRQNSGVTLVEILIATTVFSLFMAAAFGIFRSSQTGFESGSWRLHRQKEAQIFLLRLKEVLEKANHAYEIGADGQTTRVGGQRPIFINGKWSETIASASNNGVMFFSINTPYVLPLPEFGQPLRAGIWKGVGLECNNNTLRCYMTGDWNLMPPVVPAEVGSPDLTKFVFGNSEGDFSISLSDVAALGVFVQQATEAVDLGRPELFIRIEVIMEKPRSNTRVMISEQITAKVQDRALGEIVTAGAGSYAL
jgi:prepilin-type N-terminal cleavage/methylation domain-containing protein